MRTPFVHTAVVELADGAAVDGPGAAITLALCGSWEHDPPCPLAAHHTRADAVGDEVRLRVLFAAEPADEARVRALVESALAGGSVVGPDGRTSRWTVLGAGPGVVEPEEAAHGERLTRS
ncbi:hypothetical protein [Cellulomonas sp. ICMP 17802]|uniref:hypothetical protein n=1 Tax=Cellulomonas sp. ICMP 17802 TaxID=3239199 RepID=UPI00351B9C06